MEENKINENEQEQVNGGFIPPEELTLEKKSAEELAIDLALKATKIATRKCEKLYQIKKSGKKD